jgi:uncharacterized protein DUF4157
MFQSSLLKQTCRGVGRGLPLARAFRREAESFFGVDFASVRIHIDPLARSLGARAFASGETVVCHPGQYNPSTEAGRSLLIHELTHVVQQRQGVCGLAGVGPVMLDDPRLEAEADTAATRFPRAEPTPVGWRTRGGSVDDATVIQCQKWGAVGRPWIIVPPNEYVQGRAEQNSWAEVKDETTSGKLTEYKGIFGLLNPTYNGRGKLSQLLANRTAGWVPPPDSFQVVKYNSTASENEVYDTRANAWNRVVALVTQLGAIGFTGNNPQWIYYILGSAGRQIRANEAQVLIADATRVNAQTNIVWVRYKQGNTPDAGGQGIYYDFGPTVIGANKVLIVEHTQDQDALLSTYTSTKNSSYDLGVENARTKVKHFHVVGYPQASAEYIAIDTRDGAFDQIVNPGGIVASRIRESELLTAREGYADLAGMPGHHIYYLA